MDNLTDQQRKIVNEIKEYLNDNVHDTERKLLVLRQQTENKIKKNQSHNKAFYDKKHIEACKYKENYCVMIRNFDSGHII